MYGGEEFPIVEALAHARSGGSRGMRQAKGRYSGGSGRNGRMRTGSYSGTGMTDGNEGVGDDKIPESSCRTTSLDRFNIEVTGSGENQGTSGERAW
jgi:hypothetical protein